MSATATDYIDAARRDAVENVASEIVVGIKRAMVRHGGDDPEAIGIVVLGIEAAVREMSKQINPAIRAAVIQQLSRAAP